MGSVWFVRSGAQGRFAAEAVERGVIGFGEGPTLAGCGDRNAISAVVRDHFRTFGDRRVKIAVDEAAAFVLEMQVGDTVVTAEGKRGTLHVGEVAGGVEAGTLGGVGGTTTLRAVSWRGTVEKRDLPADVREALAKPRAIGRLPACEAFAAGG